MRAANPLDERADRASRFANWTGLEALPPAPGGLTQISAPIDVDQLRTFLAERLVRYKIPRTFEFVEEVVRGHDGKVRRSALRADRS